MLVDTRNSDNKVVAKINNYILETFMIDSFKPAEIAEFRWYDVNFQSEIEDDIAYISFAGEYYGAYVSNVEDRLFFSLKTGENLDPYEIPFQALFKLESYFDFINKFWLDDVNHELGAAKTCSGVEASCSPYDINYGGYFADEYALQICPPSLYTDCEQSCFNS